MRPLLKPALRRVWRDETTLQIGLDPERALVLAGLDPPAGRLVESLDGSRDVPGVLEWASSLGVDPGRARHLLDLLVDAGVLVDGAADRRALATLSGADRDRLAPDLASLSLTARGSDGGVAALARRRGATVLVAGAGRVGAAVAALVAAAGVGHVVVQDPAPARAVDLSAGGLHTDALGARREDAARVAMRRLAPSTRADAPPGRDRPDVAVLAPTGPVDGALVARLLREGVAHLLVEVREATGVVGPLVLPGRSSCLRCADLHRTDRDPAWPRVAAQLASPHHGSQTACDGALAALVAAQAALQVLALLDGAPHPPAVDGTLETRLPGGSTRRRSWPSHPACGCRWPLAG